ncbi:MAG TPA: ECF-type sigma factor [Bryobacteraceae bacterium]|nr:ECF-type sigma factor [Bryobacteraceae bacterium]
MTNREAEALPVNIPGFELLWEKAQGGDWSARDAVYKIAFYRLRSIASALLRRERRGHTLQPTALVAELFLKLHRLEMRVLDEDHFFRISARAMRQVLIDHARSRAAAKKVAPESVSELLLASHDVDTSAEDLLAIRNVFGNLQKLDPAAARTVWLRSVEGLTLKEVARDQSRQVWRVRADYDFGIQWMAERISSSQARSRSAAKVSDQSSTLEGLPWGRGS